MYDHVTECPTCGATIEYRETRTIGNPDPKYFLRSGCSHITTAEQARELDRGKSE